MHASKVVQIYIIDVDYSRIIISELQRKSDVTARNDTARLYWKISRNVTNLSVRNY